MSDIKLNLVTSEDLLLNPGDAMPITNGNLLQLIMICPGCGKISSSAGSHIYDLETKSYSPSIVHDVNLGGCGWHGWLKNGVFQTC